MSKQLEIGIQPDTGEVAKRFRRDISRLLDLVGDHGYCKGCGKNIWWIRTPSGKRAPYTDEAKNHFADCFAAQQFRGDK